MLDSERIKFLIENKKEFQEYLYTPLQAALAESEKRAENKDLQEYLTKHLPHGIPEVLNSDHKNIVIFRHIASPNYETCRFLSIADGLDRTHRAHIFQYTKDKFNDRNQGKYYLSKLRLHKGYDKNRAEIFEKIGLIDFVQNANVPIHEVKTKWGEGLVDLHHAMFDERFPMFSKSKHDVSDWLHKYGQTAREYYKPFLLLFMRNGILFDNFLTNEAERTFTEMMILPLINEIESESGYKPLIVSLDPSELEEELFWLSYPAEVKRHFQDKLNGG